jgi:thymidylate synthase
LTHMVAQVTGLDVGDFVHTIGDAHIYLNHLEQVKEQLTRKPYPLPKVQLNPDVKSIFDYHYEDITILDYIAHPHIKGEVSV